MIKQFNQGQARGPTGRPEWPENPAEAPTLFSERKALRKLRVLVDAELIDVPATGAVLDKATVLLALLHSEVVEWYRYTDGLPPSGIAPATVPGRLPRYPVYAGWAVTQSFDPVAEYWPVVYSTNPQRSYTVGGVRGNAVEIARNDAAQPVYLELDPEHRADRRGRDALALEVADQALHADVFVTRRPYLYSRSLLISGADVTICTLDDAIPLIGLYLRAQGEFVLPTAVTAGTPVSKFRFGRGLYFWVGARELLPEAWRWFSACVQHSTATKNDELQLLGGTLLSRVTKALQERDDVHIALNKPPNNDTSDGALSCLDNVLVSLMGAVDVTARVVHYVLNLSGDEREAGWQRKGWYKQVAAQAPTLAAVVAPGTPRHNTLTILRLLRNSVHGAALQGITYLLNGKAEMRIGLPSKDEAEILAAMDAMGGRASWGVRSIDPALSHVAPGVLVDRLFEEVVPLLNNLMKATPVESLPHVTVTEDTSRPPRENPPMGTFETFSEWNRLAIRWQLGF